MAPGRSELWVPISYQPTSLPVAQPLLRSWYGLRLLQLTSNFDNPTCVIRLWDSLVNSIKQPSSLNEKFHAAADPTWLCFVQILFADCCILHSSSRHKHTQLRLHSNIFFFFSLYLLLLYMTSIYRVIHSIPFALLASYQLQNTNLLGAQPIFSPQILYFLNLNLHP